MENLFPIGHYANELRRHLPREYFRPVPRRLLWMIPHLVIATTGMLVIGLTNLPVGWQAALGVLIGLSFGSLGFLGHEVLHGTVIRKRWLMDVIGAVCFAPFNLGPRLWRKWHNVEHHGHTQHPDDDPDTMATLEKYRERSGLQVLYRFAPWLRSLLTFVSFTFWFSFHSFTMMRKYLGAFRKGERAVVVAQFVVPLVFWLSLIFVLGPVKWLFAYLLPALIANFLVMSYISTNHLLNPLAPVNDPLVTSLTVRVPRWVDVLHMNFSHHTEHHIFPTLNPKWAPQVRTLAKRLWPDRYNEMPHWQALLTLWRTPRLYCDETSLIDPQRSLAYPTLGHGLDPRNLQPQPLVGSKQEATRGWHGRPDS